MTAQKLSPAQIRNFVSYDASTGKMFWKPRVAEDFSGSAPDRKAKAWNTAHANNEVGPGLAKNIRIYGRDYPRSHLIWAVVCAEWPSHVIDHIDGDRTNNRLSNLRAVTQAENLRNLSLYSRNKSGRIGVSWRSSLALWEVRVARRYIGRFTTFEEACAARAAAERASGFHPNHGRRPLHEGAWPRVDPAFHEGMNSDG